MFKLPCVHLLSQNGSVHLVIINNENPSARHINRRPRLAFGRFLHWQHDGEPERGSDTNFAFNPNAPLHQLHER